MSDSVQPHRWQTTRLPHPWDSPGKNTGVGCHFLLQCVKVKSLSHVRLFSTPLTAAYQAPLSMGFSRQDTGVGCHCLLQCMKVKSEREVAQLCPTLHDPMVCSLPGSSVHGIFQARVLKWGAIAFSYMSLQLCPTLCDPIDGRPPGSPVPGILQARTLEWVAISFSNA